MSFVWLTANMAIYRAALRAARPNAVPCKTCSVLLDVDACYMQTKYIENYYNKGVPDIGD
jgi:hypothetical protein